MSADEECEFEHLDTPDTVFEGDFSQTIALLEMETEELHFEVEHSLEEVSDYIDVFVGKLTTAYLPFYLCL